MADIKKVVKGLEIHANGCGHISSLCHEERCPYRKGPVSCDIEQMCHDALELLKEQPQWIPVVERLPKSMANKVIVFIQHEDLVSHIGYGHFERYNGTETWFDLETHEPFSNFGYFVTHWMPLPNPPEGM